jgi:hypothetical protein
MTMSTVVDRSISPFVALDAAQCSRRIASRSASLATLAHRVPLVRVLASVRSVFSSPTLRS